ncbi:Conserved_hypothetical protein [Hexamita inflata]|uniref:Uncharacterized protein n=1 Tax=Hexamita inflata TaxID=28002 RepID=A0ABP1GHC1_9EUKA
METQLIIEPDSDISKIQIINFILLPNSKKHFEGPPLYVYNQILNRQNNINDATSVLLGVIRKFNQKLDQQLKQSVIQKLVDDFQQLQILKLLVTQTQHDGIVTQLRPNTQRTINQYLPRIFKYFNNLQSYHVLYQGEILKFFFDFFDFIPQDKLDQFLANIPDSVYEKQFTATVLAQGFKQVLTTNIIKSNKIKNPSVFVLKMINCSQLYMFQNETCCLACCALIKACNSPQYFEPALNVMIQLLKDSKVQQSTMAFANLLAEQIALVDDETKLKFVSALIEQFQSLSDQVLDDALVFILQLLAICSRVCVHPCFNVVMNAAITQESHESDLTQALFLFVDNYICTPQFVNGTYTPTNLRLQEGQSTQINQSSQLIKLLTELIQKPTVAEYAYQTLNLLLRCNIDLDTLLLTQIISYNSDCTPLYKNRALLKQVTIFYSSLFNKFDINHINNILQNAQTNTNQVFQQIIVFGCQQAFTKEDSKQRLADSFLKLFESASIEDRDTQEANKLLRKNIKNSLGWLFGKKEDPIQFKILEQNQYFKYVFSVNNFHPNDSKDPENLDQICLQKMNYNNWRSPIKIIRFK